jgi:hypothetical protein
MAGPQSLRDILLRQIQYPEHTGGYDEVGSPIYDPSANLNVGNKYFNPATEDPGGNAAIGDRIYQQRLSELSALDLLKANTRRGVVQSGVPLNAGMEEDLIKRMDAAGWDEPTKKAAVLSAIDKHYQAYGQPFTEWSGPEGIAGLLGLPTGDRTAEYQKYAGAHGADAAEADANSMTNAIQLGSVLLAPLAVAGAGALGAGAGAGAELGGAAALEAGALAGAPGYGAALEGSLAGIGGATTGASALTDASWGVNPTASPTFGSEAPNLLGQYGNLPSTIPDFTALAPTQNLGAGSIYSGATTGAAGGGLLQNLINNFNPAQTAASTAAQSALGGGSGSVPPVAPPGQAGVGGAGTQDWWSQYGLTASDVGAGAAGGAATSALGRILSGAGTAADWASVLGTAGSTALGVYGSNQQADALRGIADQARTDRQPFLNKSLEWLNNPQAYQDGPGKQSLDATLRALSVQGNPIGNPGSLAIAGDIANKGWQNAVTGFGNLGLAGQDSRSQLLSNAATADRGVTTALSSGLGSLTQPDSSLDALLKQLRGLGGSSQFGLV